MTWPLVVFNMTGWNRSGVVEAVVDFQRAYGGFLVGRYGEMERLELPELVLKDAAGQALAARIEDLGVGSRTTDSASPIWRDS